MFFRLTPATLAFIGMSLGSPSLAQFTPGWVGQYQSDLYDGQIAKAEGEARLRLRDVPDDQQAQFALGAAQFLHAVEHLGQSLYRYGMISNTGREGLGLLPILRLPVPPNPHPDAITYQALRDVLSAFADDLASAETSLKDVHSSRVQLTLSVGRIRLDLDGDGTGSPQEDLGPIFQVVTGMPNLSEGYFDRLMVDFDGSDVLWLRAYCHLLTAIVDFPLAYDWSTAYDATFQNIFPSGKFSSGALQANTIALQKRLEALRNPPIVPPRAYPDYQKYREWLETTEEGKRYSQIQSLQFALEYQGSFDLVAFIHLVNWPAVEPERLKGVLDHLQAMVTLSRASWNRILGETDSSREWIPNLAQLGVLPMRLSQERIDGWFRLLDELDGILAGKKLIPHWRFEQGVNLRRLLLESPSFDLVLLIQGSAAVPYLEDGEKTDGATWQRITDLFEGDFLRYFLWIN